MLLELDRPFHGWTGVSVGRSCGGQAHACTRSKEPLSEGMDVLMSVVDNGRRHVRCHLVIRILVGT